MIRFFVYGVHGHLAFPDDPQCPTICIAGGIGATPFRSLFRSARSEKAMRTITFVHVASKGFLYEEEFSTYPITQYKIGRRDVDATLGKVVSGESFRKISHFRRALVRARNGGENHHARSSTKKYPQRRFQTVTYPSSTAAHLSTRLSRVIGETIASALLPGGRIAFRCAQRALSE